MAQVMQALDALTELLSRLIICLAFWIIFREFTELCFYSFAALVF